MTTEVIRERLYSYIKGADDSKIKNIYDIFEDQMAPDVDWSHDDEFVAELNERVKKWEDGVEPGFSIDEVKVSIEELRRKRLKNAQ